MVTDGLQIRYPESAHPAPNGVDLQVRPGEVVLLLGPSGSGKSSLSLSLNGLIPHVIAADVEGSVTVAGQPTMEATVAELSTTVAMVFQDPDAQIVTEAVFDEVCFGPENQLVDREGVVKRAEWALRRVGLWERRRDSPDVLSGGGRQRLAIACALAMNSPVIVLDEPTANLDPDALVDIYDTLTEIRRLDGRSIVLIEHNLDAAIPIVDRVLVLDAAGRLALSGGVGEVLRDRAEEVAALGVWLPVVTMAALRLRAAGVDISPLPLTPAELTAQLNKHPAPAVAPAPEPPPAPAVLEAVDLSLSRHKTEILHDISLTIGSGEFWAIVGGNGAGKTTLLQTLAGINKAPKGQVHLYDFADRKAGQTAPASLDPGRIGARDLSTHIGFVFQNPEHEFVCNTVYEELAHGLVLRGMDQSAIDRRVTEMLDRLGLNALADRNPFLLSGGQKRRLSVGAAFITDPPILALDEPTYGQDRDNALSLLGLLKQLHSGGTTVVVVSHDLQLVVDHATHLAVLAEGKLVASGEIASLLNSDSWEVTGLRRPVLSAATQAVSTDPQWHKIHRLSDLPPPRPEPNEAPRRQTADSTPGTEAPQP